MRSRTQQPTHGTKYLPFRDDTHIPNDSNNLRESSTLDEEAFSESAVSSPAKAGKFALNSSSASSSSPLHLSHSVTSPQKRIFGESISSTGSTHPKYYVPSWTEFIDNSQRIYHANKLKCGVTVMLGQGVLEDCHTMLEDLNYDLIGCLSVLPPSVRGLVRRTKIWVNREYSYGPVNNPKIVKHTTTHHYAGWLICVRDNPAKEESIEIYNAPEYQKTRAHYNGGGLMLHELCHIIHQKALPGGLNNPMVSEIHRVARDGEKYASVLRRDWALKETDSDMAYCIVNHKEFFAEISVTYLADFYHEVDGAGSTDMAKCSPPFVATSAIERIQTQQKNERDSIICTTNNGKVDSRHRPSSISKYRIMARTNHRVLPHCNKFFPFTKGQLRLYDPRVYRCFEKLWQIIESWEDNNKKRCESCVWF